jgi:hypothetical protein
MNRRKFLRSAFELGGAGLIAAGCSVAATAATQHPERDTNERVDDEYCEAIFATLDQPEGGPFGTAHDTVVLGDGEVWHHNCGMFTGMAGAAYRDLYQRHFFKVVPKWVRMLHAIHSRRLCELAMKRNQPLPASIAMNFHDYLRNTRAVRITQAVGNRA